MTITVDINVLLDVFQKREPHYPASAAVVGMVTARKVAGVFPAHGLTTLYYLARKHASKPDAEAAMDRVLAAFQLGNLDRKAWQEARGLPMADFEDAAVAMVAKTSASSLIITRNTQDFANSPVPAISPADFLSQMQA